MNLKDYQSNTPTLKLETFLVGPLKAWGILQNWRGQVTRSFEVNMHGSWENNIGELEETFNFNDGETQKRTWKINKLENNVYTGTAHDIINKAKGKLCGNAAQWKYQMDLPVGDKKYRITFDDWMWQINESVIINRSYLKKWGVKVAELTLLIQKQNEKNT